MNPAAAIRALLLAVAALAGVPARADAAGPTIPRAHILESGQLLWVPPLKADGTNAWNAISAVGDGATLKVNGRAIPLVLPAWNNFLEGFFYPLCGPGGSDPPARPGDTVTATFPAGCVTVAGMPTDAAVDVPVTFLADAEFCHPIKPPKERTLRAGYNVGGVRQEWFEVYLADRSLACDAWEGCTLDDHFEMVANDAGTARRTVLYQPSGDRGMSDRGVYLCPDGASRFEFVASGVPFDDSARKLVGLVNSQGGRSTIGPPKWTDLGGGRWRLEQDVRRPADPAALWTQGLRFVVPVPGLVVQDWRWFDPLTPVGWDRTAHPHDAEHYKGKVTQLRPMDRLGTNFSPAARPGDYCTPADRATPVSGGTERGFRIAEAKVLKVRAPDLDPATDADRFYRYFDTNGYFAWVVMELDRPADAFAAGVAIQSATDLAYPSTVPGVNLHATTNTYAFPVGGNNLLVQCAVDAYYPSPAGTPLRATLQGPQTPAGVSVYVRKNHLLPPETHFACCRDLDAEPWVNFSAIGTDAYIDWLMDLAIAGTPDGRRIHGEFTNEHWNAAFNQFNVCAIMAHYVNWQHSQDPGKYPFTCAGGTHWYVHRSLEARARCRARLVAAGRDPDLLVWHFGGVTQSHGHTDAIIEQARLEGATLDRRDRLSLEAYQDGNPPGGSWSGPDLAATWSRCSPDGFIDVLMACAFRGSRALWMSPHRAKLDAAGFKDCKFSAYEGGPAYTAPDNDPKKVVAMMASHRMYRFLPSFLSLLQDCGYVEYNEYLDRYTSALGGQAAWTAFTAAFQAAGTGDPRENPDPFDYPNVASQRFGGLAGWNAGRDFDAAVPPVDPDARPATPTPGSVLGSLKRALSAQIDAMVAAAAAGDRKSLDATAAAARAVLDLANQLTGYFAGPKPAPAAP